MSLKGRRALITGASRSLGPAIAISLARRGVRVAVNHRTSPGEAERVIASLPRTAEHLVVAADVSSAAAVDSMVGHLMETMGGVDILVNNAGPYGATPLSSVPTAEWDRVIDTNLKATWLCTRAVAPLMEQAGWGRVVNISAVSAHVRNRATYGLAKASVELLTEQLALEMGRYATVNAVAPGQIAESLAEMSSIDREWAAGVTDRTPRRRLVTRGEVGEVVALLCTEPFASMTGTTLHLDGGLRFNRF